ncbi:MAG: hypothetical protein QM688_07935 [Sphingomonas bacterium]
MNDISTASLFPRRPFPLSPAGGTQALHAGLELARASQLTLLRLQLALHGSDRRAAMQALDNLLDMDAEMEGLATALAEAPTQPAGSAELASFIGHQKAAIAAEKHVLTGIEGPNGEAPSLAIAAPRSWESGEESAQQVPWPDADAEAEDHVERGHGRSILAFAIVSVLIGFGVAVYLWPPLQAALRQLLSSVEALFG